MNRLFGLLFALVIGLWAQRILTGPEPGIPRDALILFVIAAVVFTGSARPPQPLRWPGAIVRRSWRRPGLVLTLAGLGVGVASLILLWRDLQSPLGLLLWPVATLLFVGGTFWEQGGPAGQKTAGADQVHGAEIAGSRPLFAAHWDLWLLALILILAWWARFHQLDIYPNGCQSDECNNGLDALKWLSGAAYTPYAETNEGQATLFTYLIALSFRIFGVDVLSMRFVAATVGVLTVAAFYFLARDLYGRRAGLAAAALLAADRWHITFSRIVYELIMQPLFMILLFFFLLRGLRTGRRWYWALAGVSLAAGLNTYTAFRVVPFIVAAFLVFWVVREGVIGWRAQKAGVRGSEWQSLRHDVQGMALLAGAAVVAVLPLGIYIVHNWRVFTSRMQHISVMRDVERAGSYQPIRENLRKTLTMFNWQGDAAALNNLPAAPMLGALVAVLFVLGLAYSFWHLLHGRPVPVLYGLWFLGVAALAVFSVAHEAPSARRTIGLIPLVYLCVALVTNQFLVGWEQAFGGLGRRAVNLAVAAVVALAAVSGIRTYFAVQAPHPDVWGAYSPNESAVGEFLATLPNDTVALITPQFEHHSAIKLIGRGHAYRALNPVADIPYRLPADGPLTYVLEPVDQPLLSLLGQVYPSGAGEVHSDRFGRPLFISYTVPQADVAATQGITGQYFSTFPPSAAPEAVQPVGELDLDMTNAPLPRPYFALWEGTLLVPEYGDYTFDLLAEGDSASLQIGREHRLDLPQGGTGRLEATLAQGFHPLRLEYRSEDTAGRLRLRWSGPGLAEKTVGGDSLYSFSLGNQGMVGYYYPNSEWQGAPALVRNDLLITPNNPLREPFSIVWRGKIAIPQSGDYLFGTRSDDGSYVFIDGQLVVDNGGSHGAEDRQGVIYLDQGFHDLEVRYFELGGSREMQFWWQPPGQGRAIVDSQYLFPLEGAAIPEGMTLPPPPQIAQPEPLPPPASGATDQAGQASAPPTLRQVTEFLALTAEVLWEFGACGAGDQQLATPRGVAISPVTGEVFVADAGNRRIVRLTGDGQFVQAFAAGDEGIAPWEEPFDLVVEPTGMVLVLDATAQALVRFTPEGELLDAFGEELTFYRPRGLGVDAAGGLLVADTGGVRIVRLEPSGALLGQIGGRDTGLAERQPTDAVATPQGDVTFVEAETGAITRVAADGTAMAWTGPAPSNTIEGPHLALRPAGGVYVTDPEGRRVLVFDGQGEPLGQFGLDAGLGKPVGIAAVPEGADSDLVVVVDSQGCRMVAFRVAR